VIVVGWIEEGGRGRCSELKPDGLLVVNPCLHAVASVLTAWLRDLHSQISRRPVRLIIRGRILVDKRGEPFLGDWVRGRISRSFKTLAHAGGSYPAAQHLGSSASIFGSRFVDDFMWCAMTGA
jgi:hypothetical protein